MLYIESNLAHQTWYAELIITRKSYYGYSKTGYS